MPEKEPGAQSAGLFLCARAAMTVSRNEEGARCMDAEPVTPDAFPDPRIPELPPELRTFRIRTHGTCIPPVAIRCSHRHPASIYSARGTHPWPIRRPARFAFSLSSARTRRITPPKGSKPMVGNRPATRPCGRHRSEELRPLPGLRSEFLAGESLDHGTPSFPAPRLAKADARAWRAPLGVRAAGKTVG